jgi:hypothetical protein
MCDRPLSVPVRHGSWQSNGACTREGVCGYRSDVDGPRRDRGSRDRRSAAAIGVGPGPRASHARRTLTRNTRCALPMGPCSS